MAGSLEQLPPMMDYDIPPRTHLHVLQREPLLSLRLRFELYDLAYANLRTSAAILRASGSMRLQVDIRNTGNRAGRRGVQLYVRHLNFYSLQTKPGVEGFPRIVLQPGKSGP